MKLWNREPPGEYIRVDLVTADGSVLPVRALRKSARELVIDPMGTACVVTGFRFPGLEIYYQDQPVQPLTVNLNVSKYVGVGDALTIHVGAMQETHRPPEPDAALWDRVFGPGVREG